MKYSYSSTEGETKTRDGEAVETADAVEVYLRDIAEFHALEGPEERALADRLESLRTALRREILTHEAVATEVADVVRTLADSPASAERFLRVAGSSARREALQTRTAEAARACSRRLEMSGAFTDSDSALTDRHENGPTNGATNGTASGATNGNGHGSPDPVDRLSSLPFQMPFIRDLAQKILAAPGTPDDRESVRAALAAYGDAVRAFATHYLEIAVKIARRTPAQGLSLADLIQEGNTGLLVAVDRYQPDDGPFSEFARGPVQEAVRRYVSENARIIRIPPKQWKNLRKLTRFRQDFFEGEGREASILECARHLGVHEDEVRALDRLDRLPVSIDEAHDEDDESNLGDTIEDEKARPPIEGIQQRQIAERLHEVLRTLSVRERNVLRLRFGLGDANPHSLQEVAEMLRVSPNRVRKIQANAVRKIHDSDLRAEFEAYVADSGED